MSPVVAAEAGMAPSSSTSLRRSHTITADATLTRNTATTHQDGGGRTTPNGRSRVRDRRKPPASALTHTHTTRTRAMAARWGGGAGHDPGAPTHARTEHGEAEAGAPGALGSLPVGEGLLLVGLPGVDGECQELAERRHGEHDDQRLDEASAGGGWVGGWVAWQQGAWRDGAHPHPGPLELPRAAARGAHHSCSGTQQRNRAPTHTTSHKHTPGGTTAGARSAPPTACTAR